jgi:hypothetical protein
MAFLAAQAAVLSFVRDTPERIKKQMSRSLDQQGKRIFIPGRNKN